ncbi:hypothetical protein O181_123747 [Austropuccinia psidii MF-1]|uniref:Uncharacterized protein n=1 Tax=Austropuccinia psidii MF-1 TaxID=1389203 RepID=A0A9Q3Q5R2_9BASI|nr:hypothetical protein [Austropuccinia psidii MF-1]
MVHTKNGSSYSVKPDGPGQGRGKTRTRSAKFSPRKTHLEDARAAPHSPRFVPTNFDVNSETELIGGNVLRAELLSSGSHRNISVPIQKLVQSGKRRGVGNMPKHLAGGHELLLTNQELSGSGEDHRTLRSHGQCLQYGQDSYGIHSQKAGKDEQDFSTQIIDEIQFVKSSIDVEIGKFDGKLNKITLDISELKRNDKRYTDWYKLKNVRLDSITNTCDRVESKCQVQDDEMEDPSILNINYQLRILKYHVLEIIKNTNQFATHLEKSDSERQKLKNEIVENVEKIHKNYEPHMRRHSTPLTEEKRSVKGSLTPFLGENPICAKDIPKLKEWPTFSGEGEYNYIEFIRTIDTRVNLASIVGD